MPRLWLEQDSGMWAKMNTRHVQIDRDGLCFSLTVWDEFDVWGNHAKHPSVIMFVGDLEECATALCVYLNLEEGSRQDFKERR